jgi:ribosomal-protein-alanine N-acetyltransferase
MNNSLTTSRLLIEPLGEGDKNFICRLLNTKGWIRFIGNRNIHSEEDAAAYIQKIITNLNTKYWVVKLNDSLTAIGIITFIKRDYLEHHDIGFAFLTEFEGKGYAYESANAVMKYLMESLNLPYILATTIPENASSIKLLKKLGLHFEKEIEIDNEKLHVYSSKQL